MSKPTRIDQNDCLQIRLALAEEGRAQNMCVALESQLKLATAELQQAQRNRALVAASINEKYELASGDTYNSIDGSITRVDGTIARGAQPNDAQLPLPIGEKMSRRADRVIALKFDE